MYDISTYFLIKDSVLELHFLYLISNFELDECMIFSTICVL